MITCKMDHQYRRPESSRLCASLLQDLMKRGICRCGGGDARRCVMPWPGLRRTQLIQEPPLTLATLTKVRIGLKFKPLKPSYFPPHTTYVTNLPTHQVGQQFSVGLLTPLTNQGV
jgi:hypothetical protein